MLKVKVQQLETIVSSLNARITESEQERERFKTQIAEQHQQLEVLKAKLVLLQQQVFGNKSEQSKEPAAEAHAKEQPPAVVATVKRSRGKQPGAKGYGRKRHPGLPTEEIIWPLPEAERRCPVCGKGFKIFPGTDNCEELDWEVRMVRRVHKRIRYQSVCTCHAVPGIVTAEPVAKLIPKGMFAVGFWVRLLLEKYLWQRPIHRIRQVLELEGLAVSQGTLTGGLQRLGEVLQPLYTKILERNRAATHWHMDETRWLVFEDQAGKANHRWWLWVMVTADTCAYLLDPTRSATVVKNHLGEQREGIINADRYSAYQAYQKVSEHIEIAFCWSHVRRDYVGIQTGYPVIYDWATAWVNRINDLFHQNTKRLAVRDDTEAFRQEDQLLRKLVAEMVATREQELAKPDLHSAQRKALASLEKHWPGLVIFVDRPDIPMDNNEAERRLRNPVVGRKNYYGSGSIWSGTLTAALFTILQTLLVNQLDPQQFLRHYFNACAQNGGKAPQQLDPFLPWNLSQEQKAAWRYPQVE